MSRFDCRSRGGAELARNPRCDLPRAMLTAAAREAIDSAVDGGVKSGFVRSALVAGYPRLAAALEDCIAKLLRDTRVPTPSATPLRS